MNIGFFFHIPFPSSELFRTSPSRKEILRGILNADHIGFHLFEYARHFLTCCRRILGITALPTSRGQLALEYGGRRVAITCSHMSLDVIRVEKLLRNVDVHDVMMSLRSEHEISGKIVFASCDSIETLSGIPIKLMALHLYLLKHPHMVPKITMIQMGIACPMRPLDFKRSLDEITTLVTFINDYHCTTIIHFHHILSYSFFERLALWRVAHVQISTVLRDGLNTMPLEFIAAHRYVIYNRLIK